MDREEFDVCEDQAMIEEYFRSENENIIHVKRIVHMEKHIHREEYELNDTQYIWIDYLSMKDTSENSISNSHSSME